MSPKLAPLSDDPNSAIACFSSSISLAFIETLTDLCFLSILITVASTLSPIPNLSVLCSFLSRERSDFFILPFILSPIETSTLLSEILLIKHVTVSPSLIFSSSDVNLSSVSCLIPNETFSFSTFISRILVFKMVPCLKSLMSSSPLPSQLISDK